MKMAIPDNVVWRDFGGQVIILDLESQHYFGFTGSGNDMWQLIAEHGSTEQVINHLLAKYDVDLTSLKTDFEKLVTELVARGMLRISHTD